MQELSIVIALTILALFIGALFVFVRWLYRAIEQRPKPAKPILSPASSIPHNFNLSPLKAELATVEKAYAIVLSYLNEQEQSLLQQLGAGYLAQRQTYPIDVTLIKGLGKGGAATLAAAGIRTIADVRPNLFNIENLPRFGPGRLQLLKNGIDFLEDCAKEEALRTIPNLPSTLSSPTLIALLTFGQQIENFQAEIDAEILHQLYALQPHPSADKLRRAQQLLLANLTQSKSSIKWDKTLALAHQVLQIADAQTSTPSDPASPQRAQLLELILTTFDTAQKLGELSLQSAAQIEATSLSLAIQGAQLRPYQLFGVKFMLCQKRTLLGDAMGLGKTLQAIALITHLRRDRPHLRALVVCPASLIDNWSHEISQFSTLQFYVLRGAKAIALCRTFLAEGPLAIISYEMLGREEIQSQLASCTFDLLIVDEAHYIKNADAGRTIATRKLINQAEYVALMTGTPLENRLKEMIQLIKYIQPTVAVQVEKNLLDQGIMLPSVFMEQIAPVYLRRRTRDVLHELPDTVETIEWIQLSAADHQAYKANVGERSYSKMRMAVTLGGNAQPSNKIVRLQQLHEAYQASGEKMIIFSFYLAVLKELEKVIAKDCFYISGQISIPKRTKVLDEFSQKPGHSVLIAQITSAGTGLNIQAASVVILMEPQFKPSIEQQAIARAHRMGQKNVVKVHRLIAEDTVDEQLYRLVNGKNKLVTLYADESNLKLASPEATNTLSEFQFEQQVVQAEYARLYLSESPARTE